MDKSVEQRKHCILISTFMIFIFLVFLLGSVPVKDSRVEWNSFRSTFCVFFSIATFNSFFLQSKDSRNGLAASVGIPPGCEIAEERNGIRILEAFLYLSTFEA
jgi:hypothetical protein